MAVTIDLLKHFEVLSTLSEKSLESLAKQSILRNFSRRAIVLSGGQPSEYLYFLFQGRLQGVDFTLDGREVGLYFVESGDFCGELSLFDNLGQPENVIALSKSQVVLMPYNAVRIAIQQSDQFVEKLFTRMASRVRKLSAQRALLGIPNTTARVCGQLWMMLNDQSSVHSSEKIILNPPTHQELGIMLNLSRETVTRVFQTLQTKGIVKRDGNTRLVILDESLLRGLSESTES